MLVPASLESAAPEEDRPVAEIISPPSQRVLPQKLTPQNAPFCAHFCSRFAIFFTRSSLRAIKHYLRKRVFLPPRPVFLERSSDYELCREFK